MSITLDEQINTVRDEVSRRRDLYSRLVREHKINAREGYRKIESMMAVQATLEQLKEQQAIEEAHVG